MLTIVKMTGEAGGEWYLVRSSIIDRPVLPALTRSELKAWWRDVFGRRGLERLARMLRQVDETGCSDPRKEPREALEVCNFAGKDDSWLSAEQQLELCIRRRSDPRAEMEGVPQDMICCFCSKPIATKAERAWSGDDPAHRECIQKAAQSKGPAYPLHDEFVFETLLEILKPR